MLKSLIKLKLLKLTIVGAIVGGIVAGTIASVIAKEMCKKKKKHLKKNNFSEFLSLVINSNICK